MAFNFAFFSFSILVGEWKLGPILHNSLILSIPPTFLPLPPPPYPLPVTPPPPSRHIISVFWGARYTEGQTCVGRRSNNKEDSKGWPLPATLYRWLGSFLLPVLRKEGSPPFYRIVLIWHICVMCFLRYVLWKECWFDIFFG